MPPGPQSKRVPSNNNINHLLNFSLPPRQPAIHSNPPRRSRKLVNQVWNKERFVNAQYRFVLKPTGDYTVHFADPDIYFQWQDILQVIIPRSSPLASLSIPGFINSTTASTNVSEGHTTCPICLSPPTAPRMTKCGHVFCYPCILRYLQTSPSTHAGKWARCPICFDSIHESQLKPVLFFSPPSSPAPSSHLQMRLLHRPNLTTLSLPPSTTWPSSVIPPHKAPFHFLPEIQTFAKFMLATSEYLLSAYDRDMQELEKESMMMASLGDIDAIEWVERARAKVEERIRVVKDQVDMDEGEWKGVKAEEEKVREEWKDLVRREEYRASRKSSQQGTPTVVPEEIPNEFMNLTVSPSALSAAKPSRRNKLNPPAPSPATSSYYYYQSSTGQPVYLHSLDSRILLSQYKSYSNFPAEIEVKVEGIEEIGPVDEETRKRWGFLGGLSEGSSCWFVECCWDREEGPSEAGDEHVVSEEVIKSFEMLLKRRRAKRLERLKKEERDRVKGDLWEMEKEREVRWEFSLARERHQHSTPPIQFGEDAGMFDEADFPSSVPRLATSSSTTPSSSTHSSTISQPSTTRPSTAPTVRSFASALASSSPPSNPRIRSNGDDGPDWEIDRMWHELEETQSRGGVVADISGAGGGKKGKKKPAKKLVLVVGGSGRR